MDLTLLIGNKTTSSWSMRPWLGLVVAELPFREEVIPLRQVDTEARLRERTPAAKVPVLLEDGIPIWDSLAILERIAELAPGAGLWPDDPVARAVARSAAAEMHSGFPALRAAMPMDLANDHSGRVTPDEATARDIVRIQRLWSGLRESYGSGGPFLFGRFSAADAMYAPVCTRFRTFGVHLDPLAESYVEAVLEMPAVRRWYAETEAEPWRIDVFAPKSY